MQKYLKDYNLNKLLSLRTRNIFIIIIFLERILNIYLLSFLHANLFT